MAYLHVTHLNLYFYTMSIGFLIVKGNSEESQVIKLYDIRSTGHNERSLVLYVKFVNVNLHS